MKIKLNDVMVDAPEQASLQQVMDNAGIASSGIAVAVNSTVIPASERAEYTLKDGDSVLIIKAFYGG